MINRTVLKKEEYLTDHIGKSSIYKHWAQNQIVLYLYTFFFCFSAFYYTLRVPDIQLLK